MDALTYLFHLTNRWTAAHYDDRVTPWKQVNGTGCCLQLMTDSHSFKINHGCFKGKYVQKAPTSARHTHHTDVTKLVCSSHSVIIQECCCSNPPRVSVISKDNQLVLIPFVTHPDETLLNVWDNHSVPNGLDPTDVVGNVLLREKGQNLSALNREA